MLMNQMTNSFVVLFIAFFFEKSEAEWYWWLGLVVLFVLDEYKGWGRKSI
jgi:hypothetical protein